MVGAPEPPPPRQGFLGDALVSVQSALRSGQRAAESRMGAVNGASTVHVWRKTGLMVPDESTGYDVPEWVVELADVPCRIGSDRGAAPSRTVSTPGGDLTLGVRTAHMPVSTDGLRDGDFLEVPAGRLVGSVWQVVEADAADQQTARRVPVVAVDRPGEWL